MKMLFYTQSQIDQILYNTAFRNYVFPINKCRAYRRQFKNEKAIKILNCFSVFLKILRTTLFKFAQILEIKELNAMILEKGG